MRKTVKAFISTATLVCMLTAIISCSGLLSSAILVNEVKYNDFYLSDYNKDAENLVSVTQDDLTLSAHTDKTVYTNEDVVNVFYEIFNGGDETVYERTSNSTILYESYFYEKDAPEKVYGNKANRVDNSLFGFEAGSSNIGKQRFFLSQDFNFEKLEGEYTFVLKVRYFKSSDILAESDNTKELTLTGDFTVTDAGLSEPIENKGETVSITQDDLTFSAYSDKTEYASDEMVKIYYKISNGGENSYYEKTSGGLILEQAYFYKKDAPEYHYGDGLSSSMEISIMEFKPATESSRSIEFNLAEAMNNNIMFGEYSYALIMSYSPVNPKEDGDLAYLAARKTLTLTGDFTIFENSEANGDLYLSGVATNSSANIDGEASKISTIVRNLSGKAINNNVEVSFYINNRLVETVSKTVEIGANEFLVVNTENEYEMYFGTHSIKARINFDDDSSIDIDLKNNIIKARVKVSDA